MHTSSQLPEIGANEILRLSTTARNNINTLKRRTGIKTANILCRWAICESISSQDANKLKLALQNERADFELTWSVLTGQYSDWYRLLLHHDMPETNDIKQAAVNRIEHGLPLLLTRTKGQLLVELPKYRDKDEPQHERSFSALSK
jgi:DNA sulfur modification protein DndE